MSHASILEQAKEVLIPETKYFGTGYENDYNGAMADQAREEYARLYKLLHAVRQAHITGIQSITITGPTGSVTVPLMGGKADQRSKTFTCELLEVVGDQLEDVEHNIRRYEQDSMENEGPDDRAGISERAQVFTFCLPMRPMSEAEFSALPPAARRAYDEHKADRLEAA